MSGVCCALVFDTCASRAEILFGPVRHRAWCGACTWMQARLWRLFGCAGRTRDRFRDRNERACEGIMATTSVAIATMTVAQVPKPGMDFEIVKRGIPEPGAGQVRRKGQASGGGQGDWV